MNNPFTTPAAVGKPTQTAPTNQPALFPETTPTTTTIPAWVTAAAEAHNPSRTSITATLAICPVCHEPTFTAIDSWNETHTATIDPTHLTPAQELQALRSGRRTYELRPSRWTAPTIHERTHWTIQATRARPTIPIITPTHRCHDPLGRPVPWNTIYQPGKGTTHDQPAPF